MISLRKEKKIFINLFIVLIILCCFTVTSCNKISQNYADEINKRYKEGNPLTYNEVILKLGTPFNKELQENYTASNATGNAEWYQGYTIESINKFTTDSKNGKKIKSFYVQFKDGYAVSATYYLINGEN